MDETAVFPYTVRGLKSLSNTEARELARMQLFQEEWLRVMLPEAEWQSLRLMPVSLVKSVYPDVWLFGPHAVEYKEFWHQLRRLLVVETDSTKFNDFLLDAFDIYDDYKLTGTYQVQRETYFDARSTFAFAQVFQLGWLTNKAGKTLFGDIIARVGNDGNLQRRVEGALGLMTLIVVTQHLTPQVDLTAWATMLTKHDALCAKWGLPTLSTRSGKVAADA